MSYDRLVILDKGAGMDSFQGIALETISGGDIVCASGTGAAVVGSHYNTYATSDILLIKAATMADDTDAGSAAKGALGVAITTATSGNEVAFLRKGTVILPAGSDDVLASMPVKYVGYGNHLADNQTATQTLGYAYTTGTGISANVATHAIVRLDR